MAKIERTKNATRNIKYGVILKVYSIFVPFMIRTAMIYIMGVEYLGLNSLFSSILQVLNLAELGVGSAMIFSMYKPIAEDDEKTICALMSLYKTYYRIIGIIILVIGCILTPFIPNLISGEVPNDINVYVLYLLNLAATVISYWLYAYKSSILYAHQRTDIISKVNLITSTIQYILQLSLLWLFHNYYLFVVVMLIVQALTNLIIAAFAYKLYPNYIPKGKLSDTEIKSINCRIRDLFTAKFGSVVIGSADTIVISAFLGLKSLAIYQNYYFIMNSICGFLSVIFSAITAGIGNSLVTESKEKNYNDFKKFTFIICFLLCICCCCFAGLYQPFMEIWVGKKLMLNYRFVILFCILFYCLELAMIWATIKDAAGLWHSDRFRPLIGAIANLVLNIVMVRFIGLYGIILSTVFSYVFISMPWLIHNLFKYLFKKTLYQYLKEVFIYISVTIFSTFIIIVVCNQINLKGIPSLFIKGIICVFLPILIQFLIYRNKEVFNQSLNLIKIMIKKEG